MGSDKTPPGELTLAGGGEQGARDARGRSIRVALDDVALAQIFNFPFRVGVWSIGGTIEVESPIGLWVAVEGFAAPDGQTIAFPRETRAMPPIFLIPWSLIRAARLGSTPVTHPEPEPP